MSRYMGVFILLFSMFNSVHSMEITLGDYLGFVEKNSKELYMAQLDRSLAETQESLAKSQVLPMVAGSVSYGRQLNELTQSYPVASLSTGGALIWDDVAISRDNKLEVTLGVSQNLFNVSVLRAIEASEKYRSLTTTIYEAKREAILTVAKKVYFQTLLLEQVYSVKQKTLDHSYDTYMDIQVKYENEIASELDVLQAKVNYQINIPEATQAERNLRLALSNLKFLGGLDHSAQLTFMETLNEVPDMPMVGEIEEIFQGRSDYIALLEERELRDINISKTQSDFYPTVKATGAYYTTASSDDFAFDELSVDSYSVGVTVDIPIFYGGSRFSKLKQAKLELAQSELKIKQKQDEIENEVNNIEMLLEESKFRMELAKTTLETAEKAHSIMELSYKSGLATQLDLKDALLNLEGAQLNFYKANYDFLEAYFNWQHISGDGAKLPHI